MVASGLFLGGCINTTGHQAPDGYRYEYTRSDLHRNENGEWVYTDVPIVVPVWKTKSGPETGPYRHEPLNEGFTGYEADDVVRLREEMGMTPGQNQWPAGAYITEEQYNKKYPPKKQEKIKFKEIRPKEDRDGFLRGGWNDSSYGNKKNYY